MSDAVYKVRVEGEGIAIEREVSAEIGKRVAVLVLTGGEGAGASKTAGSRAQEAQGAHDGEKEFEQSDVSAREFMEEHGPKRAPDKIAALVAYMKKHEGKKAVSSAEIKKAFEDAA